MNYIYHILSIATTFKHDLLGTEVYPYTLNASYAIIIQQLSILSNTKKNEQNCKLAALSSYIMNEDKGFRMDNDKRIRDYYIPLVDLNQDWNTPFNVLKDCLLRALCCSSVVAPLITVFCLSKFSDQLLWIVTLSLVSDQ